MSASGRTPATCPVCGADMHPKDRYCPACGADAVASGAGSGSLFDDLMPADDRRGPAAGYGSSADDEGGRTAAFDAAGAAGAGYAAAATARYDRGHDDDHRSGYPEDRSEDAGYGYDDGGGRPGAYDDAGYDDARYDEPGWSGAGYGAAGAGYGADRGYGAEAGYDDEPPRRGGRGRGSILLPIAILAVVVVAAIVAWQLAPRGGGSDTAASTTQTSQEQAGASSDGSSPSSDGSSSSPSPSKDSPSESSSSRNREPQAVELPSSAQRCDDVEGTVAYRGNDITSCDFAVAVASALANVDQDLPTKVTARSPVTNKDYTMQCRNTSPVTCRGGNDALVYVDRR